MGRYETLNAETKDIVNCLLPGIAAGFGVMNVVDIIPEDIRMRQWDCDRRDHIKDKTEDDPRNWGVQFLRDLMSITRLKSGNLDEFQADLRTSVSKHDPKHPWCRLADIKDLKEKYEHPNRATENAEDYSSDQSSSDDSYFEELVEEPRGGRKRGRRGQEVYEARPIQKPSAHRKKYKRLRRGSGDGWARPEKPDHHTRGLYRRARNGERVYFSGTPTKSERAVSTEPYSGMSPRLSPYAGGGARSLHAERLRAEMEAAEAEARVAKLRAEYLRTLDVAPEDTDVDGPGTQADPKSND
ncbi:hypothetical protein BDV95DRAFT_229095 [Massariosphaeria phaeospora]|uniref:Uncharacterized protein n=1 Tax=Massariosphaeria phaeospora TaxID=100035 RepID=A0A7C8ICY3_9PLEO|nr:hypothetical protein BDV95DRAFT_229095 [Massariosphaeria phaeospora]